MPPKATKLQAAFSLALLAAVGIAEMESSAALNVRQPTGVAVCIALWVAGLVIWWRGKLPPVEEVPPVFQGEPIPPDPPPPPFYKTSRYWGMMLLLSATVLAALGNYRFPSLAPAPLAQRPAVVLPSTPGFKFPPLELKILIVDRKESSVLMNGEVMRIGETNQGVRLVAVDGHEVTLEFEGHTNVVLVPK